MKKKNIFITVGCMLLIIVLYVVNDKFVFYDFHESSADKTIVLNNSSLNKMDNQLLWFEYDDNKMSLNKNILMPSEEMKVYTVNNKADIETMKVDNKPKILSENYTGTFLATLPEQMIDLDGDGKDEKAPRDACPLIKAVMGSKIINGIDVYDNCSSYIVPTSCDCKKKMGYLLSEYKDVYMLHVPTSKKDDESINYYLQDLYELKEKLEEITGNKITYDKLADAVDMISEVQYEISRFYKFKMHKPALIRGTHAMAIMNSFSYDNAQRWGKSLKLLNDELQLKLERKEFVARENSTRIMITGSPIVFPNIKLPLLIEEMGGVLVADETCMGDRGIYDPVSVVDDSLDGMMRALVNRYILPCTCPTFVKNKQRLFKIKQMIKDYKVEGVIYHVLRGCLVYDYEYNIIEEMLNEMEIPVIRVKQITTKKILNNLE